MAQPTSSQTARIYYQRPDNVYDGWGLHVWEDANDPTQWAKPLPQTGRDPFGAYWDVPIKTDWKKLGFIIHKGDEKDSTPDLFLNSSDGNKAWIISGNSKVNTSQPESPANQTTANQTTANQAEAETRIIGDLSQQQAIMLSHEFIAVKPEFAPQGAVLTLHSALDASLTLTPSGVQGSTTLPLQEVSGGLSQTLQLKAPYLNNYKLLRIMPEDRKNIAGLLKGQLAVSSLLPEADKTLPSKVIDITGVQTAWAIDSLYSYSGPLGLSWEKSVPTLRLWAPTAQEVKLHLSDPSGKNERTLPMIAGPKGVWFANGKADWKGLAYRYEVKVFAPSTGKIETNLVTDPYSVGLTLNSLRSLVVDLNDATQKPDGWDALQKPALRSVADLSFYELHLRDFSAADQTVPAEERGTYLAFSRSQSDGMKHLKALADAGLKAVHLLPTFDIATIDENKRNWKTTPDLSQFAPNSEEQQKAVGAVKDLDAYNWGYDPYHYMVPEGSYAVNADRRTREYRRMVMSLNQAGLRVIQDVVFNHTNASGQNERSVLDKIVPNYYYRLNVDGVIENSTCCSNTATEHNMMRKLMVDTVILMAKAYKIDGFRFDLMGHHMIADMQAVKKALGGLTLKKDGVDGKLIYIYGEGWNFGEVKNNRYGPNATQLNLAGEGIGSFNDRIRDAVRGGNPFSAPQDQGFATGLFTMPNGREQGSSKNALLRQSDIVRLGLAGNLGAYQFTSGLGKATVGVNVRYGDQPAGYAFSPLETINYVSAHDNQTLYDAIVLKAPLTATNDQRVRMQNMAHSIILLAQGLPFSYAGDDILRSKSFDADSYNSGDWFNTLDWTLKTNGFGKGLPLAEKNASNWDLYHPLLGNPQLKPTTAQMKRAVDHYREMLQVRYSSTLFRLETAKEVQDSLSFFNTGPNQVAGVIGMKLSGAISATNPYKNIVVIFNSSNQEVNIEDEQLQGLNLFLHPVLANSTDAIVKESQYAGKSITVSALTTAVFVEK